MVCYPQIAMQGVVKSRKSLKKVKYFKVLHCWGRSASAVSHARCTTKGICAKNGTFQQYVSTRV